MDHTFLEPGYKAALEVFTRVRDALRDPLSFSVIADPVVTRDGHTYDRATLDHHFESRGFFDPLTR